MTTAERVATLQTMVDGWLTQLAADAAGDPNIDHSIDGETISPTAWRESLWSKIKETNAMINVLNGPWVIRSRGRAV